MAFLQNAVLAALFVQGFVTPLAAQNSPFSLPGDELNAPFDPYPSRGGTLYGPNGSVSVYVPNGLGGTTLVDPNGATGSYMPDGFGGGTLYGPNGSVTTVFPNGTIYDPNVGAIGTYRSR